MKMFAVFNEEKTDCYGYYKANSIIQDAVVIGNRSLIHCEVIGGVWRADLKYVIAQDQNQNHTLTFVE